MLRTLSYGTGILAVCCLLGVAAYTHLCDVESDVGTLASSELHTLFGGQDVMNVECSPVHFDCNDEPSECSDADGSQMQCSVQREVILTPDNIEDCSMAHPGWRCRPGPNYVCKEIWMCVWDAGTQKCLTIGDSTDTEAPDWCTAGLQH